MKEGLLYKLSLKVVPVLLAALARVLFATCRVRTHGAEYREQTLDSGRMAVVTFWHYSFFGVFPVLGKYDGVVMVSSSRDGEYIARLAHTYGLSTVRGSRNNKGVQALKELIRAVKNGESAAIVADGSQGPPLIAQPGGILLSSRAGAPVLPVCWSASRYWAINSWDRTIIPKPFSRVEIAFGRPLQVPGGLKSDGVEEFRAELERVLHGLYRQVWAMQGKTEH